MSEFSVDCFSNMQLLWIKMSTIQQTVPASNHLARTTCEQALEQESVQNRMNKTQGKKTKVMQY